MFAVGNAVNRDVIFKTQEERLIQSILSRLYLAIISRGDYLTITFLPFTI